MVDTGDKVEQWLRTNQHRKFVGSTDMVDDIDATKRQIGIAMRELTEEQWGNRPGNFINPFYTEDAHQAYYQDLAESENE